MFPWQLFPNSFQDPTHLTNLVPRVSPRSPQAAVRWETLGAKLPLDFNMLLTFSSKHDKRGHKLGHMLAGSIMHIAYKAALANIKMEQQVARKAFNIEGIWNVVCCRGNKTVMFILWSTFSRILQQRIRHSWYYVADVSFFINIDQNLVEPFMYIVIC